MGYARKDVEKTKNSQEICSLSGRCGTLQHWADKIPGAGKRGESSVQD